MKIYTKKGDYGQTSIVSSERYLKNDPIFNVMGTIDELVAYLNIIDNTPNSTIELPDEYNPLVYLVNIATKQSAFKTVNLFLLTFAAHLSQPNKYLLESCVYFVTEYTSSFTQSLEKSIDGMSNDLPPLRHFILPGDNNISCMIHYSRTICRRLERECVSLHETNQFVEHWLKAINRLSDYLFTLGRYYSKDTPTQILKFENNQYYLKTV